MGIISHKQSINKSRFNEKAVGNRLKIQAAQRGFVASKPVAVPSIINKEEEEKKNNGEEN